MADSDLRKVLVVADNRTRPWPEAPTIRDTVLQKFREAQFIISTHSPSVLGYPDAQILSFDDGRIHEVEYEDTTSLQVVRQFVNDHENFLEELLKEDLPLFESKQNSRSK